MTFVSYAQNYEDVMLWRALREVTDGFYIDVGAWSPEVDSVTKAFSERGWRGINIEPNPHYFSQLVEHRPNDVNLSVAVGDHQGSVAMSFFPDSGLSTADPAIAKGHVESGWMVTTQEVPLVTLRTIWSSHVPQDQQVHFLKVDVEGLERAVLVGNDWALNRPWIVVVEATLPASQVECHSDWEDVLEDARYIYAYADGLNRYYVASERAHLAAAFKYPPNVFDGFVTSNTANANTALASARADLAGLEERFQAQGRALEQLEDREQLTTHLLQESNRRVEFAERCIIDLRVEYKAMERATADQIASLHAQISARDQQINVANQRAQVAAQHHAAVLASTSWRITAPMRWVVAMAPMSWRLQLRRSVKAIWWAVTPWRLPARFRFLRERERLLRPHLAAEAATASIGQPNPPDLNQRPSRHPLAFAPQGALPALVVDDASAARWCMTVLRSYSEVRARFPAALTRGAETGFVAWVLDEGGERFALSEEARARVVKVLKSDFGGRARQYFLFRSDLRETLPHGLTPTGLQELYRWFEGAGRMEGNLPDEEVEWLLMEATEQPALELVRAYKFTPAWQRLHPAGLTVFGQRAFSKWFAETYGGVGETWTEPSSWPVDLRAAELLTLAYGAHPDWRSRFPDALRTSNAALELLGWLRYESALISTGAHEWVASLDEDLVAREMATCGVTIIGHFCSPSGVRVSAEAIAQGLRMHGVRVGLRDVRTDVKDDPHHVDFDAFETADITLIHTQPEPFFDQAYQLADLAARPMRPYRIAYWYWEFDTIPATWLKQAEQVDEVWVATEFVAKGMRDRLPPSVPVRTLFPGVQLAPFKRRPRSFFGLPEDHFLFVFNFHMNSVMERKNPLGLIRAFLDAFRPEEPVTLVLKTLYGHHHPEQMQKLSEAAAGANVRIIDAMYSADEVLSLMDACDAYVSLHRSEGLGLTMAEAMLLAKPVVATSYSGNMDFMDEQNSLLVPYKLVKLGAAIPPYEATYEWADPDLVQASRLMRRLFDEPHWAREMGLRGRDAALARLSIESAGARIRHRLHEIREHAKDGRTE